MSDQRSSDGEVRFTDAEEREAATELRRLLESARSLTDRLCMYSYDDSRSVGLYMMACSARAAVVAAIHAEGLLSEQLKPTRQAKP
jgi:hypothetical protein